MEIQLDLSLSDDHVAVLSRGSNWKEDKVKHALIDIIFDSLDEEVEDYRKSKRLDAMQIKMPGVYLVGSDWKCPVSPDGWCWYGHDDDPCHDQRIFCGKPEERK